jgi:hypothetical protein
VLQAVRGRAAHWGSAASRRCFRPLERGSTGGRRLFISFAQQQIARFRMSADSWMFLNVSWKFLNQSVLDKTQNLRSSEHIRIQHRRIFEYKNRFDLIPQKGLDGL